MSQPVRRYYAKASRASRGRKSIWPAARWSLAVVGAVYLSWSILFPGLAGLWGQWIHARFIEFLGYACYLIPVLLGNEAYRYFRHGGLPGVLITAVASLICLASASGLLSFHADWGGWLGGVLHDGLAGLGGFGSFLVCLAGFLLSLQAVLGIRLKTVAAWAAAAFADDFRSWQKARQELKSSVERAPKGDAAVKDAAPAAVSGPAAAPEPVNLNQAEEKPARSGKHSGNKAPEHPRPAAKLGKYQLPPLDLLKARPTAADTGKPLESEVKSTISVLEQTFKDFAVSARVSGYAPGPVITRYEVTPAPGVKVSAFVALEKDIARALKAKGIRIIAPIPGRDAVGIEIPNARPALVVLREVLESAAALPPDAPLLSFAVGLSASGEAMAANLQSMPHLLVAGATNSGKSVFVHSLILSILYRARPDEVKFLLIDPKRLELTFYEGIPHLFDPIVPADKVTVVTNPKEAANSLANLVKIMESRYQRFQLYGVRNIDGYNKEADKRGEPREYFIVVVIDELADLMLVAGGKVEDNIQRLAQMARAVGIHMVLATQRPSVDIITGVIKANLPCRVAMQVISQIDSRVILDIIGAETLQGRGDMLYRNAGSQIPQRCQGAYVSEDEINRVAGFLREQGKPDYPELETMPKPGEADLASFGVTPLEFSQALKLVLERRRVSQDLLKSQFGSSARATNILSLLEVKGLIHKPDGSNRWEIHFDEIEACLRADFPQVPIGDPRR